MSGGFIFLSQTASTNAAAALLGRPSHLKAAPGIVLTRLISHGSVANRPPPQENQPWTGSEPEKIPPIYGNYFDNEVSHFTNVSNTHCDQARCEDGLLVQMTLLRYDA